MESLNIIYPTPPTPAAYQPSPQASINTSIENEAPLVPKDWLNSADEPSTSYLSVRDLLNKNK